MKTLISFLAASVLLCGCNHQDNLRAIQTEARIAKLEGEVLLLRAQAEYLSDADASTTKLLELAGKRMETLGELIKLQNADFESYQKTHR